jgi:uncharacterized protein YqfB (UPF0267 family)
LGSFYQRFNPHEKLVAGRHASIIFDKSVLRYRTTSILEVPCRQDGFPGAREKLNGDGQ